MSDMKGVLAGLVKAGLLFCFCACSSHPDSFATWANIGFYIKK